VTPILNDVDSDVGLKLERRIDDGPERREEEEEKEVSFPNSKNISSGLYRTTKAGRVK
jgi:hypothetical protein